MSPAPTTCAHCAGEGHVDIDEREVCQACDGSGELDAAEAVTALRTCAKEMVQIVQDRCEALAEYKGEAFSSAHPLIDIRNRADALAAETDEELLQGGFDRLDQIRGVWGAL